jgi:hypothetical protein
MPEITVTMDPSLSTIPTSLQIISEGVPRGTRHINKEVLRSMYRTAASIFEESILRPATSVTAGGQSYRAGSRATGNFTFGDNQTFQGVLIDNGPVQGLGFPDIQTADQRTDRAWRVLEEGTDSMRMPVGSWRDPGGNRVPWGAGSDDAFHPGGSRFVEVSGIEAKRFIQGAVDGGVEALGKAYSQLADDLSDLVVQHRVPGTYRNETFTVYKTQNVPGHTRKSGTVVKPYTRQVPVGTRSERVFIPLEF